MKFLHSTRVKLEAKSPKRTNPAQEVEAKVATSASGAKKSLNLQIKRSWRTNSCWSRRQSGDLLRVKCFNCDNNGHLAKDYPKPFQVSDCIAQGKLIIQRGFMAKIGAHKSKASNLLKLNCKINDEIVGCLLDSGATNLFMILQVIEQFRVKIELVANPITVQLARSITRPFTYCSVRN